MTRGNMQTEKVLNHILEIIYLMTGEEYMIVKKPMEYKRIPQVSSDLCPTRNSIVEIPSDSLIHLRRDGSSSSHQLHHGFIPDMDSVSQGPAVGGHVQIKCDEVAVYLSVEEWEYLEKHKDQFKEATRSNSPLHAETLIQSQDGAQTPFNSRAVAQTPLNSQAGAQTPINLQYEAQNPPGVTQTPLNLLGGALTSLSSRGGAQTSLNSLGGVQTSPNSLGGAQTPPNSLGGAQTPPNSLGGAQTPPNSLGGAQTPPNSPGGAQTPLNSLGGTQTPLNSLGGTQTPLNSRVGAQTPLSSLEGAQTPLNSLGGAQTPLNSLGGAQTPLNSLGGAQTPLNSLGGAQTPLNSLNGAPCRFGATNPFSSQYGDQISIYPQNQVQSPVILQDVLSQGHIKDCNRDQNCPDLLRTPETANRHLGSMGKRNKTNFTPCYLSKYEVDKKESTIKSSSDPSELLQLNTSPCLPACEKAEDTLAADRSCMESLTDGYHSKFSPFDPNQGQHHRSKYLGVHFGLENMENIKNMSWNVTSSGTSENSLSFAREYSDVLDGPPNMTVEQKEHMLGLNKDVTALLDNPHLNYEPFPGLFVETQIKKELTNRGYADSVEVHQTMVAEENDAILSLNKHSTFLENSHSLNSFTHSPQTPIKKEASTLLDQPHFVKKPARCIQKGTFRGAIRSCGNSLNSVTCTECGKVFSCNAYLIRHQRIHTGEKPYTCSDCGRSFTWFSSFITHKRTHTGEKPFSCTECGKRFKDYSGINKHLRIHTGEKPFSCVICEERFAQTYQLAKHQLVHFAKNVAPT